MEPILSKLRKMIQEATGKKVDQEKTRRILGILDIQGTIDPILANNDLITLRAAVTEWEEDQ